ncbi:sulfotransferase family 2 domain-containing protein [Alteromonas mediterranea]|uniref:sulfotransferase family 2 domain-containing protein n=1 Tax=Alteromonas mediterranea TaxID=314275 RepID=UPI0012F99868|nr:sulfotransferase family 2 domain-containing protein [Alteromonas mediterranea]QGX63272.1 hypothetical protein FJN15_16520 [Alteromonas mediterranea]
MLNNSDIKDAFFWLLGREPESEKVYESFSKLENRISLREAILQSQEFQAALKTSNSVALSHEPSNSDLEESKLIFLHIPKTGGTTVHSLLSPHFESTKICPAKLNTLGDYTATELSTFSFFSGHFSIASCQLIPGLDKKLVTFMREPQARLRSAYYFWKSHDPSVFNEDKLVILSNKLSFVDFLEHEAISRGRNTYNPYCQLLTSKVPSGDFSYVNGELVLNDYDQRLVELSLQELEKFYFVGFLENFNDCAFRLLEKLGIAHEGEVKKQMVLSDLVKDKNSHFKNVDREIEGKKFQESMILNTYLDSIIYDSALKNLQPK